MATQSELTDLFEYGIDTKNRRIYFGNANAEPDQVGGFTAASAEYAIKALHKMADDAPNKPIELHVNSEGGDCDAAFRLCDEILASPCQIKFIGGGAIMSAASIVMCVCDERYLHSNATVMVHEGSEETSEGSSSTHTSVLINAAESKRVNDIMYGIYAANSRMPREFWEDICQQDVYMSASEAVSMGLADKVIEPKKRGNLRKMRQHGLKKEVDTKEFKKLIKSVYKRIGRVDIPKIELNEPVKEPSDPHLVIAVDQPSVPEQVPEVKG